jgi:YD repeat-containing protein
LFVKASAHKRHEAASDVRLTRNGNDLVLAIRDSGDQVTLNYP